LALPRTIAHLFVDKSDSSVVQLLRYTMVGGLAFVVDFGILVFLTAVLGVHYLLSAALGFLAGLATNYALSVSWVFSRRSLTSRSAEFTIFAWIGVVGLGLNELLMWVFTDWLDFHYSLSKVFSTFAVFTWNFVSRKVILFRGAAE